jgi:drug/metabolite transporter (DMT)-like permease
MIETHSHSHRWPGIPLALGSAALFGATAPLSKMLLEAVSPFMLAGLLYLGAGIGLALYGAIRNRSNREAATPLTRQDLPWLFLAISMGGVLGPVLLMFGLTLTTASSSAFLLNLEGLATMAIAWLVYK